MKKVAIVVACLVGAFFLLGALVGNSPEAQEREKERAAISVCWESYERKSLGPAEKRFIASTCEMMEMDFAKKHGSKP